MKRKPGQKASSFSEKSRRLVRSWETMMLLAECREPLSSQEINDRIHREYPFNSPEFRCTTQTTTEDLKTLQKCGFPVCRVDKHGKEIDFDDNEPKQGILKYTKWRLRDPKNLVPYLRQPTATDIVSLSLCRALLSDEMPSQYPLQHSVSKMLEELQIRLNKMLRQGETVDIDLHGKVMRLGRQYVGKSVSHKDWKLVSAAITRRLVLKGNYENRFGETTKVDIAPLAVWFSEGRAYVLAAGATDRKVRAWRIDRLSDFWMDEKQKAPEIAEEEIDATLRKSFKGYISDPVKVHLKVKPESAYLFREFQYHPSQEVIEHDDGSMDVTMECAMGWGLEEWILGFGELVVVEAPEELQIKLSDRVKKLHTIYCNG